MSKPVFEDVFKLSGRRNRKSYLLFQLASLAGIAVTLGISAGIIGAAGDSTFVGGVAFFLGAVAMIVIMAAAWITSAQRVRDIGYSGVWTLVQLIPYIGWIFSLGILIAPGDTEVDNKFGPSCIK